MGGLGCLEALSAGLGEEVPEPGSLLKSSPPPWGAGVSSTGLASAGIHVWGCSSCCGLLLSGSHRCHRLGPSSTFISIKHCSWSLPTRV